MTTKQRRRATGTRSTAGCRTCRARHVKCDETPGSCRNCSSTGRVCEGYDFHRLPRSNRKTQSLVSLTTYRMASCLPGMSSDERRCFAFFQNCTVPTMVGYFDSGLWQQLVLQMSQAEPAVYHAIVALSAIHEDSEARGMPLSKEILRNNHHRFALEQCGRAVACLNGRRGSKDPKLREVTLMCCLLFVMIELLRGQYDNAFIHLQNGVRILKDVQSTKGSPVQPPPSFLADAQAVEKCLVEAFAHLDIQSAHFGVMGPLLDPAFENDGDFQEEQGFQSLAEARKALDPVLNGILRISTFCSQLSAEQIVADYANLATQQMDLSIQLDKFVRQFETFRASVSNKLSKKELRGLNLIRLHHMSSSLLLRTSLGGGYEMIFDDYLTEFEAIVTLAEDIALSFSAESKQTTSRPNLSLDMGVIPPLFFVATKCRDAKVRWRAIQALRSWPHREGLWDSNLAAAVALEVMSIEMQMKLSDAASLPEDVGEVPQSSRIYNSFATVAEDQSCATIAYRTVDQGVQMPERTEVFDVDKSKSD